MVVNVPQSWHCAPSAVQKESGPDAPWRQPVMTPSQPQFSQAPFPADISGKNSPTSRNAMSVARCFLTRSDFLSASSSLISCHNKIGQHQRASRRRTGPKLKRRKFMTRGCLRISPYVNIPKNNLTPSLRLFLSRMEIPQQAATKTLYPKTYIIPLLSRCSNSAPRPFWQYPRCLAARS